MNAKISGIGDRIRAKRKVKTLNIRDENRSG